MASTTTTKATADAVSKALTQAGDVTDASGSLSTAQNAYDNTVAQADSPTATPTKVATQTVKKDQLVSPGTGTVDTATNVKTTTGTAATADDASKLTAAQVSAIKSLTNVDATLDELNAAKGSVTANDLAKAATLNPTQLAQLGLSAAQIAQAQQIVAPNDRTLQNGELVNGSSVNQSKVDNLVSDTSSSYATADPTEKATVQGQMSELMTQFEDGNTPSWAAPAIRSAQSALAARGLSASSLAGQALVQAAMESALPIAQADAATYANFELTNLNNKQAATMLAAQQRATFLGQEFDQNFQAKTLNAATITSIANKNYDTSVQIALENANLAQSVDLANLSAQNAKILSDAAAMTTVQTQNLSNQQQAALQNAQTFLQMDLSNLDREQQTSIFKTQERVNSIMTDTAAENAASQFNATSTNETNQFMANLQSQIEQFNASQKNAMTQTNVSQQNAMAQFKAEQTAQKQQFNAANQLVIAQANAAWHQQVSTNNTAAINAANLTDSQNATTLTVAEYNNEMQARRDAMSYILTSTESAKDRATEIITTQMTAEAAAAQASTSARAASKNTLYSALGSVAAAAVSNWAKD